MRHILMRSFIYNNIESDERNKLKKIDGENITGKRK